MTRDEAITYLKVIWNRYATVYKTETETTEAYRMAIEALKGGDAKMNPIPNGTGVMQGPPSEDGSDLISRADAIEQIKEWAFGQEFKYTNATEYLLKRMAKLPIKCIEEADRPTGEWSMEEVAELLAELFDDECACNYNDIDEWLPDVCDYSEIECPVEGNRCWIQFLKHRGADMRGKE